jgi:hypothetical protein
MPAYTYPAPVPTVSGDYLTIHRLLSSPDLIARRLRTIAEQRFIADSLLTARFPVSGGAVWYEQPGESLYTDRNPEAVGPAGEYPLSTLGVGPSQIAQTVKWGQDVPVTDESIKRLNRNPVDRAFLKMVNQMVKLVDGISLAAIATAVTQTTAAAAGWSTATAIQIFKDVALAKANIAALNQGYNPDTVVLSDFSWTYAMAAFIAGGFLPRESAQTAALTGQFPVIDGMRWLVTPNIPTANTALVLDSTVLGGMADEQLGGPGYSGSAAGVEVKSIRDDLRDGWRLRARRITVPVVIEPGAAWKITGV